MPLDPAVCFQYPCLVMIPLDNQEHNSFSFRPSWFLTIGLWLVLLGVFINKGYESDLLSLIYTGESPMAPAWRLITLLGSSYFLGPLVVVICISLLTKGRGNSALAFAATWATCALTVEWLKFLMNRARPPVPLLVFAVGNSFPSGHATQSMIVYSYIVGLIFMAYSQSSSSVSVVPNRRAMLSSLIFLLPLLIGISRVWLGAHWPSDVLVGWGLGLMFSAIALSIRY